MGFLKDGAKGEGPDHENDPEQREEDYEKMFMKIGRDFVHKDDFQRVIRQVLNLMGPMGLIPIDTTSTGGALARAVEYKGFLDSETDGSTVYPDLIKLDEEDEEEESEDG